MNKQQENKKNIENTTELQLKFDAITDLLPVIVQDFNDKEILMLAYANQKAINISAETKNATFWSRSRQEVWTKGLTSGNVLKIKEIRVDCDQDTIVYLVEKTQGGACHTKNKNNQYRNSCFYRKLNIENNQLEFIEK